MGRGGGIKHWQVSAYFRFYGDFFFPFVVTIYNCPPFEAIPHSQVASSRSEEGQTLSRTAPGVLSQCSLIGKFLFHSLLLLATVSSLFACDRRLAHIRHH